MQVEHGELVGYVVGSLVANSHPLVIALYRECKGSYHTRIHEYTESNDVWDALLDTMDPLAPAVTGVWKNEWRVPWYYFRLMNGPFPGVLHLFNLPWTVLLAWECLLKEHV